MKKEDCFHLGAKAIIRNPVKKILLLEREPKSKKNYWDLPGGRLQKGESLIETLRREVEEETGLDQLLEIHPFSMFLTDTRIPINNENVGLIFSVFLCDVPSFSPRLSEEHIRFEWFTAVEAAQKLTQLPTEFKTKLIELS